MNCPVCGERMREIQKYSVELDICPGCRGVWLDRGELEKIIDMVSSGNVPAGAAAPDTSIPEGRRFEPPRSDSRGFHEHHHGDHDHHKNHDHDHDDHYSRDDGYGHKKRRGGWFSELFDD